MRPSDEVLSKHLPYYLTREREEGLLEELKRLPHISRFYARVDDPEPLQGDGWVGLQILRFEDGHRDRIKGIILTNSCDLAADNTRLIPQKLSFAPLIALDDYLNVLRHNGVGEDRVTQHATEVRSQAINSLYFLPAGAGLEREHVAVLFDLHSIPLAAFHEDSNKSRLFSLSDAGFYLYVFKLSVHFCRLHENIDRSMGDPY